MGCTQAKSSKQNGLSSHQTRKRESNFDITMRAIQNIKQQKEVQNDKDNQDLNREYNYIFAFQKNTQNRQTSDDIYPQEES
ncbi:hypothetical protein TTHERM_00522040 (macronuclear) [Tetrahymena thermophila SB210]|uniref:Uncharacterized protein n=1 Tax=Tetrahymena thermophila (strain SB210) TaxID=312017 RepID=I7LUJ9_TETTS|nr:hypothetical protein TTHERM_00522040 [Tetrahymena thermophila SB210]EAR94137.1 hypothetical protein TTHERM_00522040 [Tetrahymena thermophila SB210]|eukprot:XP_001014382.1 hypothetical protein TTHERM_00522040 [Tetrahymena thermophila SB210]